MVQLNPFNVIMLVYVTFLALNLSTSPITSEEREMAHKIESMLKEMRDERYKMEVEESLDYENDNDIPTAEQFELGDKEEEGLEVNLHARNTILKLQSLTQFSSPRFRNLLKYAWYKSGYVINKPEECETPVEFCFHKQSKPTCDISGAPAIITCAWCKKSLCINHFFHEHHLCDTFVP
nr:PREDICTED: uncharacterized protein LOC105672740 [Linepithema humile]